MIHVHFTYTYVYLTLHFLPCLSPSLALYCVDVQGKAELVDSDVGLIDLGDDVKEQESPKVCRQLSDKAEKKLQLKEVRYHCDSQLTRLTGILSIY